MLPPVTPASGVSSTPAHPRASTAPPTAVASASATIHAQRESISYAQRRRPAFAAPSLVSSHPSLTASARLAEGVHFTKRLHLARANVQFVLSGRGFRRYIYYFPHERLTTQCS
ncbi:hypothetical protein EON66_11370 [archaeon]|nr:MAG: hypothetical protein EON66_11370 [archaeon]